MITAHYDADDFYMLKSETNIIKIDVQIGEELAGGYLIFNGNGLIGTNEPAMLTKSDYANTWVTISVVIKDQAGNSAWASVIITLQEDSQIPKTFGPYRRKMTADMDTVCYTVKIKIRQ